MTSADESRTQIYQVRFSGASEEPSTAACLRGAITVGFSLLVYESAGVGWLPRRRRLFRARRPSRRAW